MLIVWECELKKATLESTVNRVRAEILQNGDFYHSVREERRRALQAYQHMRRQQREKDAVLMAELKGL